MSGSEMAWIVLAVAALFWAMTATFLWVQHKQKKKRIESEAAALRTETEVIQGQLLEAQGLLRWVGLDLQPPSQPPLAWSQRTQTHQALVQLQLEAQADAVVLVDAQGAPLDAVGDRGLCEQSAALAAILHRGWPAIERVFQGPVRVLTQEFAGQGIHMLRLDGSPLYVLVCGGAEIPWMAIGQAALRLGGEIYPKDGTALVSPPPAVQGVVPLAQRAKASSLIGTYALPLQSKIQAWLQRYPVQEMGVYDADGVLLLGTYTKHLPDFLCLMPLVRCLAQRIWNRGIELETFLLSAQSLDGKAMFVRPLGNDTQSPLSFVGATSHEVRAVDALSSALRWHLDTQSSAFQPLAQS